MSTTTFALVPSINPGDALAAAPDAAPLKALAALAASATAHGAAALWLRDSLALRAGENAAPGLDAGLLASALGPLTAGLGLIAQAPSGVAEPFHTATALQTADHASLGRAGLALAPAFDDEQHSAQGRWPAQERTEAALIQDADDTLEAIARLWESWEPDAAIRDAASGRFLDRDRIHPANFTGARFSIEGASITPRSPQGRPPVFIEAGTPALARLAADRADVAVIPLGASADGERETVATLASLSGRPEQAWVGVLLTGQADLAALAQSLERLRAAGFSGAVLHLSPEAHTPQLLAQALAALAAVLNGAGEGVTEASGEGEHAASGTRNPRTAGPTLRAILGLTEAHNPHTLARKEALNV